MSSIVDSNFTFLQGMSSFWQSYFKDKSVISTLLKGSEQLMGQLYLDLLELVLSPVLHRCPVYHKEYWHLLTISNTELVFNGTSYVYEITNELYDFRYLLNKVLNPSLILERNIDFTLVDSETKREIHFSDNIFDTDEYPNMIRKMGQEDGEYIISFWIPDARFDKQYLYENFGFLVKRFDRSSEAYKTFIRGIWHYYTNGPNLRSVESAMNLITGFPVVIDDDEVVESIEIVDGYYIVITSKNTYRWVTGVGIQVAVGDVLDAFQPLTSAFTVEDYQSDPDWFDGAIIPEELMPNASFDHRISFKERIDPVDIGEIDLTVDGSWYVGTPSKAPTLGYKVMRNFLATHIFLISYDASLVEYEVSITELREIVLHGKPAHTYAFVQAVTNISDEVEVPNDVFQIELVGTHTSSQSSQDDIDVEITSSPFIDVFHYGSGLESSSMAGFYDPAVIVEEYSASAPWSGSGLLPEGTLLGPILLSPSGYPYWLHATEDDDLATVLDYSKSNSHRVVVESPDSSLWEIKVDDTGILEAVSPPESGAPTAVPLWIERAYHEYGEVRIGNDGILETEFWV